VNDYEKLGAFYLGRRHDLAAGRTTDELVLYDAKDLTTHAVCVGMTGSGKTGLCISLLEEAAIDGIPAIAIDPKGDLGNLLLAFPELRPEDFLPWIDPAEATRAGRTLEEHARATAQLWQRGLAEWGQSGERIARLRAAADFALYTPGGSAGLPLAVLRSFAAPQPALAADPDARRERILSAVSGLLALAGVAADPLRSREHILLSALIESAWAAGRGLDLPGLIRGVQRPPFERLGVLDLESFFPAQARFELATGLNSLLASPAFAAWMQGPPLDVSRLLYAPDGRPRVSILSIAHLSDVERMFFVTVLLNEVVAWMRGQSGTSSLRALLYMDEVFGFFPPTANPPSKLPLLTLMKQARAYGLGVVLATQNPVDLDYKGLSNAGTWFLGRLQTERDKARVLDGLEGASAAAGAAFDRASIDRTLSALSSRVFLLHNVHEDEPVLFHTRWALSYLRGPLTRDQIARLVPGAAAPAAAAGAAVPAPAAHSARPVVPPKVTELFAACSGAGGGGRLVYRPALLGSATLHYASARADVDVWRSAALLAPLDDTTDRANPWRGAALFAADALALAEAPEEPAAFADLPAFAARPESYARFEKALATHLQHEHPLVVLTCQDPRGTSRPGQSESEFRAELRQQLHEARDRELEKLRRSYAPRLASLAQRIRRAEARVEREQSQYQQQKVQTAISMGATLLGALFGRKLGSVGSVGRATTAARGASRAARERTDALRAAEDADELRQQLAGLEAELEAELGAVRGTADASRLELGELAIRPRKTDLAVERVALVWTPWRVDDRGFAAPAFVSGA
jgi:DNA helicase HerA-like ATPase